MTDNFFLITHPFVNRFLLLLPTVSVVTGVMGSRAIAARLFVFEQPVTVLWQFWIGILSAFVSAISVSWDFVTVYMLHCYTVTQLKTTAASTAFYAVKLTVKVSRTTAFVAGSNGIMSRSVRASVFSLDISNWLDQTESKAYDDISLFYLWYWSNIGHGMLGSCLPRSSMRLLCCGGKRPLRFGVA